MSLDRDIDLLRQVPMLVELPDEHLRLLAFSAETRQLEDGAILFQAGDKADAGYLVVDGTIELITETRAGPKTVSRADTGCLLGEMAMITQTDRPATAVAAGPARVLEIRRALLWRMMQEYPDLARRLHQRIAEQLRGTTSQIAEIRDALMRDIDDE